MILKTDLCVTWQCLWTKGMKVGLLFFPEYLYLPRAGSFCPKCQPSCAHQQTLLSLPPTNSLSFSWANCFKSRTVYSY